MISFDFAHALPASYLRTFRDRRVVVVGEAILDGYLAGHAERLSREAPVPIVELRERVDAPGGGANTAVNLAALGAHVELVSVVGDDDEGKRLRQALRRHRVGTENVVVDPGRETLAKQRVSAGGQVLLRFDSGTTDPVDGAVEDRLIASLEAAVLDADAVIVSDYGYGVVSDRLITVLGELQRRFPRVLLVDARDLRRFGRLRATAVKPNYPETCRLLGETELRDGRARAAQIGRHGERLLELTGARICAVTIDTEGAVVFEAGHPPYRTYATPRPHSRAAGAGDTFIAALALALASGAPAPAAAELASTAAAIVVGRDGTSICALVDLEDACQQHVGKRLDDQARILARIDAHRREGRRIVFTNGCFDILHRGHVTYLARAKALGDVLVVGVNSDASVARLKGPARPINALDDRLAVLEALSSVDHVIPFHDDVPTALVRLVRPDIFVKGGDYTHESLPEARVVEELGGSVRILPFVEDRSTSNVIARVRDAYGRSSERLGTATR